MKTFYMESFLRSVSRKKTGKYLVLLSGGVESTVSFFVATRDYNYINETTALFFNYGQTNYESELFCVENLVNEERLDFIQVDLRSFLKPSKRKPKTDRDAFIPARNLIFASVALKYIYDLDMDGLIVGHSSFVDEGTFYDNSYYFWKGLAVEFSRHLAREVEILTPVYNMTKEEMMRSIREIYDVEKVVSCWNAKLLGGKIIQCNQCVQCKEFNEAMKLSNVNKE